MHEVIYVSVEGNEGKPPETIGCFAEITPMTLFNVFKGRDPFFFLYFDRFV